MVKSVLILDLVMLSVCFLRTKSFLLLTKALNGSKNLSYILEIINVLNKENTFVTMFGAKTKYYLKL